MNNPPNNPNPYTEARREWNERYGDFISQTATWRLLAIASLMVAAVAVGGAMYLAAQTKFIPYIVEVDKLGRASAVGPATKAKKTDERVLKALLATFVSNWRAVTMDVAIQKKRVFDVYAHVATNDPAYATLNEYFRDNDPFRRATSELVSVKVLSLLRIGGDIWEAEWEETTRDRKGAQIGETRHMKGAMNTLIAKSSDDAQRLHANPIGLYVTDVSWAETLNTRDK
ncbi:MAG: conjugal transfer protein TrbF [Sedimenticola sp.]